MYAILEGAAEALDISRNDISACPDSKDVIVLYDDTPGGSGYVKEIYRNLPKVLAAARDKVSGACGCSEETSCYGCLRNYSNQYCHDELSRGFAYDYLDWLLDEKTGEDEEKTTAAQEIRKKSPASIKNENDACGAKPSNYIAWEKGTEETSTVLLSLYEESEDVSVKSALKRLAEAARGEEYEYPLLDRQIDLDEGSVWPDIFWGESHTALFFPENEEDLERLKKYDWYCYLADDSLKPDSVLKHIKRRS